MAQQAYGLMILDAFSSDAIPVHLLTREAVRVYLRALWPDGILAFHLMRTPERTPTDSRTRPLGAISRDAETR